MEPALLVIKTSDVDSLEEAIAIAREAGFEVKDVIYVKNVSSRCYLGVGALNKVKSIVDSNGIKKLCIYDELKPRHVTCLMKELGIDIVDRVMMILTVFQNHAGSREALLQIEMARLKHQLPLIRDWVKRVKKGELPGFLSLGRYAVDVYYRHITKRIARLTREIERLRYKRSLEREARRSKGFIHIAIVGYTNAGKTTLFNTLTNLSKPMGTEMFTTLTPKSYMIRVCSYDVIVIDTVGFLKNIPIGIIESFKIVLEEINDADALILVVDGSKKAGQISEEVRTAFKILKDIGCINKHIIVALNKIDITNVNVEEASNIIKSIAEEYGAHIVDIVPLSALRRINIDKLREAMCRAVESIQKNST